MAEDERKTLERERLVAEYHKLESPAREIVQILAVVYEPLTRTALVKCLRKLGIRPNQGSWFSAATLEPMLTALTQGKLLDETDPTHWKCAPLLIETVARELAADGTFAETTLVADEVIPICTPWDSRYYYKSGEQGIRNLRKALYLGDVTSFRYHLGTLEGDGFLTTRILTEMARNPFDETWLRNLTPDISAIILLFLVEYALSRQEPLPYIHEMLRELCFSPCHEQAPEFLKTFVAREMILRGEQDEARTLLQECSGEEALTLRGWLTLIRGEDAPAAYEEVIGQIKKATRKRKVILPDPAGAFYPLALLGSGSEADLKKAESYVDYALKKGDGRFAPLHELVRLMLLFRAGMTKEALDSLEEFPPFGEGHPLLGLFLSLTLLWIDKKHMKKQAGNLQKLSGRLRSCGYLWLAAEMDEVLFSFDEDTYEEEGDRARIFREKSGTVPLSGLQESREGWERELEALAGIFSQKRETAPSADKRLIWRLNWTGKDRVEGLSIEPVEQKMQKNGSWSQGRRVSLKQLHENHVGMDYLSDRDHRICGCIEPYSDPWGFGSTLQVNTEKALPAMVEHPLLFTARTPVKPVTLTLGEPEMRVRRKGGKIHIVFHPPAGPEAGNVSHLVWQEAPQLLRLVPLRDEHRSILAILGEGGLTVPAKAKEKVLKTLASIASVVEIQSDIGGLSEALPVVEADSRPHLQLTPAAQGLNCRILVRPLGQEGPGHRPGRGGETVLTSRDGQRIQAQRDLDRENRNVSDVLEACPALLRGVEVEEEQWLLENPGDCLEFLAQLQDLGDSVALEWPQGNAIKVHPSLSLGNLNLKVREDHEWFSVSGEVNLPDGTVVTMTRLLELLEKRQGNFLPMGENEFLALTREFRQRLEDFLAFGQKKGEAVRVSPLAIPLLEDLSGKTGNFSNDAAWDNRVKRLKEAESLEPKVPSTLQTSLRDYQTEGFQWLARRAHWGVGACLADDMGLGKTLQALALLLERAPEGPALVVAPTSVCGNWLSEAARFAPTLNVMQFGPGNREKAVGAAGPFDLVVTTYGLLQQEAKLLASRTWETIILDEAQAIKNGATRRSRAAVGLKGKFRMIATGTPIENHLGELWSLFRFLNPGLLGSLDRFNSRFAVPIEKNDSRDARARLKKLVRPFVLRRTKDEVLDELPERTEIRVTVEMSPGERSLYEALRQKAIAKLDGEETAEGPGQKRFAILAEITRLRRACCHPSLIAPEESIPGAKLEAFAKILDELRENGHKALVFSQFIDHLAILRKHLEDRGIPYQYLDGSTPARQRTSRIGAFQAGEGDCFLISLKAGGLGLNLTAADYVIHMDPWWNPAVEDQASDRAHRIGQTRPVTVYRMVAAGSIEEKILELHRHKRDLADGLLEGTGAGGRLDAEELLRLIRES